TPGTGLGAVKRLANSFDMHSSMPQGTLIVARVGKQPVQPAYLQPAPTQQIEVAGLRVACPGEVPCGDAWMAWLDGERAAVMVADGLGHGPDAAQASEAAARVFGGGPFDDM